MKRNVYQHDTAGASTPWLASVGLMDVLRLVVLEPFKLAAPVWQIGVRTSFGLVNGLFYGFMGFMGLGMIAMVAFTSWAVAN